MNEPVKVYEARSQFSALLARVEAGEEVVIARGDTPVARLVPVGPAPERPLGLMPFHVGDAAMEPMDADELAAWEDGDVEPSAGMSDASQRAVREQANQALLAVSLAVQEQERQRS